MRIVHVAAELAPVAKVGGLADVVYGLSRACIAKGHQVEVILPLYSTLETNYIKNLRPKTHFLSLFGSKEYTNTMWEGTLDGIPLLLIESGHPKRWFERSSIYNQPDDMERFLYFSRAVFDYLHRVAPRPDILHIHDWHPGALPLLWREESAYSPPTVLTVHNFAHQGLCPEGILSLIHLQQDARVLDDRNPGMANLLKAAIVGSNAINTVSPTYAKEVLHGHGYGLESLLQERGHGFRGILNGIDYTYWNPGTDPLLSHPYSLENLEPRKKQKAELRKRLKLEECTRPIIAVITRLVPQKGVELIRQAMVSSPLLGAQFILLGSSPIPEIQREFLELQDILVNNPHVSMHLKYDETLSHQIYGGSDILLVPSLFEPCGLTQLIALRYGSVPMVRKTGGLADTVHDLDSPTPNGFSFEAPTAEALESTIERALHYWRDKPNSWLHLQKTGMNQDFSWHTSAQRYLDMYRSIC